MKPRTMLIAYQEDHGARSFTTFFHGVGYRVETAGSVSELLRRIRSGSIHVVLLDDEIEGVKACDLVPVLKRINGMIQFIVTSSDESLGSVRRLRGTGIFYQAMKPVDMEELKSAVECAFDKVGREQSMREGVFAFLIPGGVPA
jgi:DNA-binding NtrC family response regulator